jgi:hypothetical protein
LDFAEPASLDDPIIAEELKIAPHVVDKALNHNGGTIHGVARIYNWTQYLEERNSDWVPVAVAQTPLCATVMLQYGSTEADAQHLNINGDCQFLTDALNRDRSRAAPPPFDLRKIEVTNCPQCVRRGAIVSKFPGGEPTHGPIIVSQGEKLDHRVAPSPGLVSSCSTDPSWPLVTAAAISAMALPSVCVKPGRRNGGECVRR